MQVTKNQEGDVTVLHFAGTIDHDDASFDQLVGPLSGKVRVNTRDVLRINSIGVKGWIMYFTQLRNKSIQLSFNEVSCGLMQQAALLKGFLLPKEVVSFQVLYICEACEKDCSVLIQVQDLMRPDFEPPEGVCPACNGKLILDDFLDDYKAIFKVK